MKQIYDEWVQFNSIEREYYEGDDNNKYAFSAAQIDRYIEFLLLLNVQHQTTSNIYNETRLEMVKKYGGYSGVVNEELADILKRTRHYSVVLQLEIESYYLFAKILLDKVAHFIRYYFGDERGLSLESHDKWAKSFEKYIKQKKLTRRFKLEVQQLMKFWCERILQRVS